MNQLESKVIGASPAITVFNMNRVFGNQPVMLTDANWQERVYNQTLNIGDEIDELICAVNDMDYVEIADAVGDIFTFAYGVDYFLGGALFTQDSKDYQRSDLSDLDDAVESLSSLYEELIIEASVLSDSKLDDVWAFHRFATAFSVVLNALLDHVGNNFVFFDFEALMNEVTSSNLSKVCLDTDERDQTLTHYLKLGIDVYSHSKPLTFEGVDYYVVYSSSDQTDVNGKVYRKDKFLKNALRFRDPDLSTIVDM